MAGRKGVGKAKTKEQKRAELDKMQAEVAAELDAEEYEKLTESLTDSVKYTPELGIRICEAYASTCKSLEWICQNTPGFPNARTVYKWLVRYNETFGRFYARAQEMKTHLLAGETIEIADDGSGDLMVDNRGNEILNREFYNRSDLRVKARQWYISRLNRKVFGDKLDQEITGNGVAQFAFVHFPEQDPYPEDVEKNGSASKKK